MKTPIIDLLKLDVSIQALAKQWSVHCGSEPEHHEWEIGGYQLVAPFPDADLEAQDTSCLWEVFRIIDIPATRWEPGDVDYAIVATYATPWQALTAIGCMLAIDTVGDESMAYDAPEPREVRDGEW